MALQHEALDVLKATSGTLYLPIARLPGRLQEAVAAAYLCLRGVAEAAHHPALEAESRARLLRVLSQGLQGIFTADSLTARLPRDPPLAEVTLRLGEWAFLAPEPIAPRIWDATATLADRLAYWAATHWHVPTEVDLDCYTFATAGAAGLLFSDLWAWYDGTRTHRGKAVGFGRGLQAVTILHDRAGDLARGVDLFPAGWGMGEMQAYARRHLALAESYVHDLPPGPALDFCRIPLTLATSTLDSLMPGDVQLARTAMYRLVDQATSFPHSHR